jgi:hypothetical protein
MAAGLARRLGRRTALESVPYEIRDAQRKLTISLWFTRVALHARVHIREGGPINSKEWPPKSFYPVLRQLGIRLRDFYSTRDTFISEMIHRGENLKAIAEYCGTSVAMIERSYGSYFPKDLGDGVKALGRHGAMNGGGAKTVTSTATSVARAVGDGLTTAGDQQNRNGPTWNRTASDTPDVPDDESTEDAKNPHATCGLTVLGPCGDDPERP